MEGLLTIFPAGRKDAATQEGKGLPPLSALDVDSLTALAMEFEIDFLCLSFTSHARDIQAARTFLASVGLDKTQVRVGAESLAAGWGVCVWEGRTLPHPGFIC
jgi:hypothetical protein